MTGDDRPVGIVLGARVRPDGAPTQSLARRTAHAIALYQAGQVRALIVSGDGGLGVSQAVVMARLCHTAGIPAADVVIEPKARSTEDNIRFALPHLAQFGTRRVILISDAYHLPRARLVAWRLGLQAQGASPGWRALSLRQNLRMVPREVVAFVWYLLSGKGRPAG